MGAGPNSDVPGSVNLTAAAAKRLVVQVLTAYGAPGDNAEVVAGHLVDCDLAGVPSHGLIRVPQYVDEILSGEIDPEAKPSVHHVSSARRDIVGHRCFGQVGCARAVGEASALAADHGLGLVTVRETGHAGRIGAYAESLGRMGLLSMVFCSGPRSGHRVSPFNGREGRLATNPIAFSVPTSGEPIVGDFSSAAAPEGRIRYLRNLGEDAPEDTLLDAEGRPSTDPNVLYTTPPGTIMGLGGTRLGHRGFALGLLVEAMATVFAGEDTEDPSRIGNNVTMLAASVDDEFAERADRMARYVVSSAPRGPSRWCFPGVPNNGVVPSHNWCTWSARCGKGSDNALRLAASRCTRSYSDDRGWGRASWARGTSVVSGEDEVNAALGEHHHGKIGVGSWN